MKIGLAELAGDWRLDREITDLRAGLEGRFEGRCRFIPEADGLRQTETGILHYGDATPMQAERSYLWHAEGDRLVVRFADGRAFHNFLPAAKARANHLCGEDCYVVEYDFSAWPQWSSRWRITGPRKNLVLTGRMRPDQ